MAKNLKKVTVGYDYEELLTKLTEEELREYVKKEVFSNPEYKENFRRYFINYLPDLSIEEYKIKLENAIYESSDKYGYIGYDETYEYSRRMFEFNQEIDKLIGNANYNLAFEVIKIILDSLIDLPIDDSDGTTGEIANDCIEQILQILEEQRSNLFKSEVVKNIFKYYEKEVNTKDLSNYGIELYELKEYFIANKLLTEELEQLFIRQIEKIDDDKWYSYQKGYYIKDLIKIYEANHMEEKKNKLIENNLEDKDTFELYIEKISNELDSDTLIKKLKEYRKKYPKHNEYISYKLLDIYNENNMMDDYKVEIYELFFKIDKWNFDVYKKIKAIYKKEEWVKEKDNIIEKIKSKQETKEILMKIYAEEKMIDELFESVKKCSIYTIKKYEEYLVPKYNEELIKIYIDFCVEKLNRVKNRKDYQEIASDLRYIKRMKNSGNYLSDIINFIKTEYANRPALQDEISKI